MQSSPTVRLSDDDRTRVMRYLVRRCQTLRGAGRDRLDDEEYLQELHLAVLETEHTYQPDRGMSLRTWACTKAPYRLIDRNRATGRMGRGAQTHAMPILFAMPLDGSGTWHRGDSPADVGGLANLVRDESADEDIAAVERRLAAATVTATIRARAGHDRDFDVVARVCLDGIPRMVVAIELGVCESRVSQLYQRGLARLRRIAA